MRGIRLIPVGMILLSTAIANAQSTPVDAAAAKPSAKPLNAPIVIGSPRPADTVDPGEATVPAPPPPPVYPKRPAELPPKPPKVLCHADQLTISADNSTLAEILAAVKGCTGAKIEIPEGAIQVRSFEELGPGPVRAVLDQLLSGTPYNYVIQSSEANPLKVETVLMSMRAADGDKPGNSIPADLPATSGRKLWQHMQRFDKPDPSSVNEDGTVNVDAAAAAEKEGGLPGQAASASSAQPSDNNAAPADPDASAAAVAAPAPVNPAAPPVANPGSSGDPSAAVSDRIAQMQQMFNQRQQMIKSQNQSQGQTGSPNN